jgi:hypothetical protein
VDAEGTLCETKLTDELEAFLEKLVTADIFSVE